MPLSETEAWELWRAAIERHLYDPSAKNLAEKNRCGRVFAAVFCPDAEDDADGLSEREAA